MGRGDGRIGTARWSGPLCHPSAAHPPTLSAWNTVFQKGDLVRDSNERSGWKQGAERSRRSRRG